MNSKSIRTLFETFLLYAFEYKDIECQSINDIIMSLSGSRFDEIPKLFIVSTSYLRDILSIILSDAWEREETTQIMIRNDADVLISQLKSDCLKPIHLQHVYHHVFRLYDESDAVDICNILKFLCVDYFQMSGFEASDGDYSASSIRQNLSLKPRI